MNEEDVQAVRGILLVQKNLAVEIAQLLQGKDEADKTAAEKIKQT
jgi:hypothetical protein